MLLAVKFYLLLLTREVETQVVLFQICFEVCNERDYGILALVDLESGDKSPERSCRIELDSLCRFKSNGFIVFIYSRTSALVHHDKTKFTPMVFVRSST